jgi:O-antigen/teichoic acid export membrane protein
VKIGNEAHDENPVARAAAILVLGVGLQGTLNAAFNLILIRLHGPAIYSAAGSLLSFGTIAAAASVGIEYTSVASIAASNSFRPLQNQAQRLVIPTVFLVGITPVVAAFLHVSLTLSLVALLLAIATLFAALPTAMLLARGLVWAIVIGASGEAFVRIAAVVLYAHSSPVLIALSASLGVTVVGGSMMAAYALWRGPAVHEVAATESRLSGGQLALSLIGLGFYVPFALSIWLARHLLSARTAGIVSLATLLGLGVSMFAGAVTSAVLPRIAAGRRGHDLRRGALLCGTFVLLAGVGVYWLGPVVLPSLVATPTTGLRTLLGPLCIAGMGWGIAAYIAWINIIQGAEPYPFVITSLAGAAAETLVAFLLPTSVWISIGPLIALAVFLLAFMVSSVPPIQKELPISEQQTDKVPVSLGVMAYNEVGLINRNLTAFLNQQDHWTTITEVIVVVSGSTDGTLQEVERLQLRYPRIRLIMEEYRRGKVFAVERFIEEARNAICVVASADVIPESDCVDFLVRPFIEDSAVSMTGPRVEPEYRAGFVPLMHRFLWALHNRIDSTSSHVKLGEIVAFRKEFAKIQPLTGCDEVLLEASVIAAGGHLAFASRAVVHNFAPTNIFEYLSHRRRIHTMHLVARRELAYSPATLDTRLILRSLTREMLYRPQALLTAIACCGLEVAARTLGSWDVRRGKVAIMWVPSISARPTIGPDSYSESEPETE